MAAVRGIFSISDASFLKKNNYWTDLNEVFIEGAEKFFNGYFLDQFGSEILSYVSETLTTSSNTNLNRGAFAATGNSVSGYIGGGSPTSSTVDKVEYVTDIKTNVPPAALSIPRFRLTATGNLTAGYFGGGLAPGTPTQYYSIMDKLIYSIETTAVVPGAVLSVARSNLAATGNSTAGYFGGGFSPSGAFSTMDKVTYSSDTTVAVPGAPLSLPRNWHAATGNSTAGYFGGGFSPSPGFYASTVDKLTYSSDTLAAVPSAPLSFVRYNLGATGNSTSGYFGGGVGPGPTFYSTIDKVTYSTDTSSSPTNLKFLTTSGFDATMSSAANALPVNSPPIRFSDNLTSPNTGYFGGGTPGPTKMDKITYSSDTTTASPSADLGTGRNGLAATGNRIDGYFAGGSPVTTIVEKIRYATDARTTVPGAALSAARYNLAATGNSTAGYFGGGAPGAISTIDKVTYSTETRVTLPSFLSIARQGISASGSSTAGYFGGGTPGPVSTVDKLTYSSDTSAAVPSAALSAAKYGTSSTSNDFNGYFGGGSPGISVVDRIDYTTDTRSTSNSFLNLGLSRRNLSATGNIGTGYFAGGFPALSTMDKLLYSTGTSSISPSMFLSIGRSSLSATSSRGNSLFQPDNSLAYITDVYSQPTFSSLNEGYFSCGYSAATTPNTVYSSTDKITFSSDSVAALPGLNMSQARSSASAMGSIISGYLTAGNGATVDKIDYSSSTRYASTITYSANPGFVNSAVGNETLGIFLVYSGGGAISRKVTYSTDTSSLFSSVSGGNRDNFSAVGNQTTGYISPGFEPATGPANQIRSQINKITYSTDTSAVIPSTFAVPRFDSGASGSSSAGYFAGGGYFSGTPGTYFVSSYIDKLTYSTDLISSLPGLTLQLYQISATGNTTAGYFSGGTAGGTPPTTYSRTDKITYSTDTVSTVGSLSVNRASHAGFSPRANNAPTSTSSQIRYTSKISLATNFLGTKISRNNKLNYGYFAGGNSSGNVNTSNISRFIFSSDTLQASYSTLSQIKQQLTSVSSGERAYFVGGRDTNSSSTIDKLEYSTDTKSSLNSFTLNLYGNKSTSTEEYGYFFGGRTPSSIPASAYSTVIRIRYSSDSISQISTNLHSVNTSHTVFGDDRSAYVIGDYIAHKYSYNTDTIDILSNLKPSLNRYDMSSIGGLLSAYIAGGYFGPTTAAYSTIEKLLYSTDTISPVPGTALSSSRYALASTGNRTNGYFVSGAISPNRVSTVDKLTYSTDTSAPLPSSPDQQDRKYLTAISPLGNGLSFSTTYTKSPFV